MVSGFRPPTWSVKKYTAEQMSKMGYAELIYKVASPPMSFYSEVVKSVMEANREYAVTLRAQNARKLMLRSQAYEREAEQRRWLENRAAREYNQIAGEFKVGGVVESGSLVP